MLQTVSFCPRQDAEQVPADAHTVVISITSPGSSPANLGEGFASALQLAFDDVSYPMRGKERNQMPISRSQVAEIVAFLRLWHGMPNGPTHLLVHSDAGLRRAAAVARFAADYLGLAHQQDFAIADATLLSRLCEMAGLRPD
jgi:predicted protein tyrosine phosphatase